MILYLSAFTCPAVVTSLHVSATEKHPNSMKLPSSCFSIGMVLIRRREVPVFFVFVFYQSACCSAKQLNFQFIRPENLFPHVVRVLYAFICLFSTVASVLPLPHEGLIYGVLQRWLSSQQVLPSLRLDFWSSFRVTVGFVRTYQTKEGPSFRMFNLARHQDFSKFCQAFFRFTIIEATVIMGTLKVLGIVLDPCRDLCFATI